MQDKNIHNTYNTLFFWKHFRFKLVLEGIIVGLLSGLLVVFYRIFLDKAEILTNRIILFERKNYWFIPIWIIVLFIIAYIVGNMVKREPMISGSGIPQTEGVLTGHLSMNWFSVIIKKFIGGVLCIGAGLSLGREGPSVQLGAAVGQGVSRIFKRIKIEEKYLITSGASAGLAAAFNAPLAGVMFSLEEIHKNFSPLVLLSAMSASLTADFISNEILGLKPVFQFAKLSVLPLKYYLYVIILGIILGVFGAFYNSILLKTQDLYAKQKWLPIEFRPVIPFVLAGILGLVLPEVLGGGHEIIASLSMGNVAFKYMIILLIAKFIFSMISFGSGAPGGIFFPLLVIGGLTGAVYGNIMVNILSIDHNYINNFVIMGMAGYFTAIVRAPITGSILITEMTGSFTHLLALAVVSIVAYIAADALESKPIYESLLERILRNKNYDKFLGDEKEKNIIEISIHYGSKLDRKMVKEYKWPTDTLLVAIKRGDREIIPNGNTYIYGGDYLVALVNESNLVKAQKILSEAGEKCLIEDND